MNNNVEKIYPLTPMQEGMLYHNLMDDKSTSYFVQNVIQFHSGLDLETVEDSLFLLTQKHEVLRTSIFFKKIRQSRQIVLKERKLGFTSKDFSHLSLEQQIVHFNEIKHNDIQNGFDLEKDPLMRVIAVKLSANQYKMIWSFHHIIMDGWCMSLIVKDFMGYYNDIMSGKSLEKLKEEVKLSARNIAKYEDYIKWLSLQNKDKALKYWGDILDGYVLETGIKSLGSVEPTDKQVDLVQIQFEKEVCEKIKKVTSKLNVTVNTIVEAAWGILLQKYNATQDAVFGKVVSGRNADLRGIEETVGLFINTVPVRVISKPSSSLSDVIISLQNQAMETSSNDYCPLFEIQEHSALKGRLIQTIVAFENYYVDKESENTDYLSFEVESLSEQTNYPLSLVVYLDDILRMEMMYNPGQFRRSEIENILAHLSNILTEIAENPDKKISDIEVISVAEKKQILTVFNDTLTEYPRDQSIQGLFEEQVRKTPYAEAVVCSNGKYTYDQLNKRADRLLGELRRRGVKAGQLVGIMTEKSVDMISGIIAILKCGCGYVPLNGSDPQSRLEFMVEDCCIDLILCGGENSGVAASLKGCREVIDLGGEYEEYTAVHIGSATDIAYVIYTSGTTGQPKGVVVEHRNVVRLVRNTNYVNFEGARILQSGSLSFDASTFEIWGPLLNGGMLCFTEMETLADGIKLGQAIAHDNINIMWMTAQLFNNVIDNYPNAFDGLNYLLIGGEKLSERHVNILVSQKKGLHLINGYGPTENTTFSVALQIDKEYVTLPIGKPISNSTAYILSAGGQLCGIGMTGELCVGGDGVARGYLNSPEMTEKKFMPDPFVLGGRMYCTGDLARWLPDGKIEYFGRIDEQVKIRGYRIELGEIESILRKQVGIKDAAVLAKEDHSEEKVICAYVVQAKETQVFRAEQIKNELRKELPSHMIPDYIIRMDNLPMTSNGKLDRRALPEPELLVSKTFAAPRNETEETLSQVFKEVLGLKNISIDDNFFEIGGHSLRAIRVVNMIESQSGIRIPLKAIFQCPTVETLGNLLQSSQESIYQPIPRAEIKETYPMSSAQKRLYIINEITNQGTAYNMPSILEIQGNLDLTRIQEVFVKLVNRHESLRTSFHIIEGEMIQRVERQVEVLMETEDFGEGEGCKEQLLEQFVHQFDLNQAPLIRLKVAIMCEGKGLLLFDMHHIISDGASIEIITREFSQLYNGEELEPLHIQYKDYSEWMSKKDMTLQKDYWINQFENEIPVLDLPLDFPRSLSQSFQGASFDEKMDAKTRSKVIELCRNTGTTEYMLMLSGFMVLLSKYSRQETIVVGSPISGRIHQDTEQTVGVFINMLAMIGKPTGDKKFAGFLEELKETCIKGYEHQEYPFEDLVQNVNIERDLSRNPLFDVMFVLHDYGNEGLDAKGTEFNSIDTEVQTAKFDLTVTVNTTAEGYTVSWEYCKDLFKGETIQRMAIHFKRIIEQIILEPNIEINDIEMISEAENKQILHDFNDTLVEYPQDQSIHHLFEEQVLRSPDMIALVCGEERMTYDELNKKANRLAHTLRNNYIRNNEIVGIMVSRRIEMFISILAVLKAGGAYLPIDPEFPDDRIQYMLDESGAGILLTENKFCLNIDFNFQGHMLDVDEEASYDSVYFNLTHGTVSSDLAYLIFTSGSTGRPKGVMLEHQGVCNLITALTANIDFSAGLSILNSTNISFDIFVVESLLSLVKGLRIVIVDEEEQKDGALIRQVIEANQVDIIQMTPSRIKMLIADVTDFSQFKSLKTILVGGEALPVHLTKVLKENFNCEIYNVYGPTETTVWSTMMDIRTNDLVSIGKPIGNTKVYITDNLGKLQPIGVKGELCIAGDGLARGYLNQPEMTEDRFVSNPYSTGKRMYRTGDLARWLPDGNIEYLGRMDDQVKIRGYRIEIGEIESLIRNQEGVRDTVVIAKDDQAHDKYIIAYVVEEDGANEFNPLHCKNELRKELPEYMIPSYIMCIEKLPVNSNGKLNRRALPEPNLFSPEEVVAPRNGMDEQLVAIFKEVLGLENVSIDDNFFEIGGHSLRATRVINLIQSSTGVCLPLKTIFERPTVRALSELLKGSQEEDYEPIPTAEVKEFYPLSSAQKRLYIIEKMDDLGTSYNMPGIIEMAGMLDLTKIKNTFAKLVARHESMRTSFHMMQDELVQRVEENVVTDVEFEEVEALPVQQELLMKEFMTPFRLDKAPLIRLKVVKVGEYESLLLFDMHHIISDGATLNIITRDFSRLYNNEVLEELNVQYKDYSEWLRTKDMTGQENYWKSQFEGEIPVLDMPLDYTRPQIQSFVGSSLDKSIDKEIKESVLAVCRRTETTEYMVLLSSLMILLSKYSRQEDIIVGSPISGRIHQDTDNMVGMFVNTLGMRGRPEGHKTVDTFLAEIRDTSINGYDHQEYPFEDLVEMINVQRDISRNPIFDVMFVLQNHEEELLVVKGLDFSDISSKSQVAKFDLTITISSSNEGYLINWEYCKAIFKEETILQMADHFQQILKEVTKNQDKKISDIEVITAAEKKQILTTFNDTLTEYPRDQSIHSLFEEQVMKTPYAEAVVCANTQLTYEQLNNRADSLQGELRRRGIKAGQLVGIIIEKSVDMISGIIAILKCGCGYVPMNGSDPQNRLQFMVEDCGIQMILCGVENTDIATNLKGCQEVIDLRGDYEASTIVHQGKATDVAYVIFTSGTTGQPKGVVVEHRNVVRLVRNTNYVNFEGSRILQSGALSFDASTFEIWGPLLNGGMLCFAEIETLADGVKLGQAIAHDHINMMWMTAQLFNNVIDDCPDAFDGLNDLIIGGEKLSEKHVNILMSRKNGPRLINGYGPTENTTFSVMFHMDKEYVTLPIGKPIANSTAYILSKGGQLCGIGMPGELCVGGDGVARGYLNLPEMTAEKFVTNPYALGERIYCTGDLARWLPDGNIEYLGRIDEQVKIRGYRIELGEIENVLRNEVGIKDCAVIVKEEPSGDKVICAYIIMEVGQREFNKTEIKNELRKQLPEYMIPSYLIELKQLPVTINGKLDRRALPKPEMISTTAYVAPRNETEASLVHVFSEVLGLQSVSIDDNFFEIGGDSIKAIRIVSKLREAGMELDIKSILQERDIRHIASKVEQIQSDNLAKYQLPVEGEVLWTPIQHEFFGWKLSKPTHFNQAILIHSLEELDEGWVHQTLRGLTLHHDALRTVFNEAGVQRIRSEDEDGLYDLLIYNIQDINTETELSQVVEVYCNEIQGSFDLQNGPLIKVGLFRTFDGMHLFICVHHLVIDGVSWRILLEDFNAVYTQLASGRSMTLPPKTASFQEWSRELSNYGQNYLLRREIPYWKSILEQTKTLSNVFQDSESQEQHMCSVDIELTKVDTNKLLYECSRAYNTEMNDLLLAALCMAFYTIVGSSGVAVELESHGRHEIESEIQVDRTVGWFTNTYPVVLACGSSEDVGTLIKTTKEMLRNVPNVGLGYGLLKFITENELKEALVDIRLAVSFNYLGDIDNEGGMFAPSRLDCGRMSAQENRTNKSLMIDGIIEDGTLKFTIGYDGAIHDQQLMLDFSGSFKNGLENIIHHCSTIDQTQYTVSDYGDELEWDDNELEDVLKLFEGGEDY